jgi:hypothetical protein
MMLAVIATFGLATATLVVPLLPQAHAQPSHPRDCHRVLDPGPAIGRCARDVPHGPP